MPDEYENLKRNYTEINDIISDEIENLKYMLDFNEIESINFYQVYLIMNDLIHKKRMIKEKIISYQLENNISLTDELFLSDESDESNE